MPEINATKNDILKAIRFHCNDCMTEGKAILCPSVNCKLYPYRLRSTKECDQMHLFRVCNSEDFMEIIEKSASEFNGLPFFWSQLRAKANCRPLNDNWWGGATNHLKKAGYRIIDGTKRSTFSQRKGGFDRQWKYFG